MEIKIIPADETKIRELENGSAFTWEGLSGLENDKEVILDDFKKADVLGDVETFEFYTWKGELMNQIYRLTGSNVYPEDLTFVSIPLNMFKNIGKLAILKLQFGARWLDDIVDNNARRELGKQKLTAHLPGNRQEGNTYMNEVKFTDYEKPSFDLKGYSKALRAISIAVAGKLNILAYAAPDCGKTMLLKGLIPYLTPCLTFEELESVKRLYALAGMEYNTNNAPFRMPHQTASIEGMCGGGANLRLGEISLAHNGTLFLDEAAEFKTYVLQMLRVPLETKQITLSRAGRSTSFPTNFQLAMAVNPCPCGNYGEMKNICLCSAKSVEMYWKKFSAPLLDCIQIKIHIEKDESETESVSLEKLREQVANAYRIQREVGKFNRDLAFSGDRRKSNIEKVALTIANMDNREFVEQCDIDEAEELVKNPFYL